LADVTDVEILNWLDDTRDNLLAATAYRRVSFRYVLATSSPPPTSTDYSGHRD